MENLPSTLETLFARACQAAQNAYAPYSKFFVGAALRLVNGEVVTGANVENSSFGLTLCAERAALVCAVSQFGPEIRIEALAVANRNGRPSPPCGACRQMLAEFTAPQALVVFPADDGLRVVSFGELLPHGFALHPR